MSSTDHYRIRDQFADALAALEVPTVTDPNLDAYDGALVLSGAVAFRLADLIGVAVDAVGDDVDTKGARARFSRGWNDIRDAADCDASSEAGILSVLADLIGAAVHDNAVKNHNPYAKAASFAMQATAALLYLATDTDPEFAAEPLTRAGALTVADDRLTHAHAWLAHLGSTS